MTVRSIHRPSSGTPPRGGTVPARILAWLCARVSWLAAVLSLLALPLQADQPSLPWMKAQLYNTITPGKGAYMSTLPPETVDRRLGKSWMSLLPDGQSIADISIPGTHGSGAMHGDPYCYNQVWTIEEQLHAGIRYFDMRLTHFGNELGVFHRNCFQNMFFDDVLNQMTRFLDENPGEAILMRVKNEANDGRDFQPTINSYLRDGKGGRFFGAWVIAESWDRSCDTYRHPRLGHLRGRILFLRDADFAQWGLPWRGCETNVIDSYRVALSESVKAVVALATGERVVNAHQKLREVVKGFEAAQDTSDLVFNHVSGNYGATPWDIAKTMNKRVLDAIPAGRKQELGVVILDFPGERLIERIVRSNFR